MLISQSVGALCCLLLSLHTITLRTPLPLTPSYVNGHTHFRVPVTFLRDASGIGGLEVADRLADVCPAAVKRLVSEFLATRLNVLRHVRDAMADSQNIQKDYADAKERLY